MAQIREIKKRIKSITNTKKVTHAMELVAAAKMRKSQQAALSARPYAIAVDELLAQVKTLEEITHPLMQSVDIGSEMIIMVTSDRGLAGGLNINLFREALREDVKNAKFITVGTKAATFAAKSRVELVASFGSEEIPFLELARTLTKITIESYTNKEVSRIRILYPQYESTIKQVPTWIQILPVELVVNDQLPETKNQMPTDLLLEPSLMGILSEVLPHHILTQIYQVLLESKASEHSARMVAMKSATDAAGDLISDLTLTYNQARQEAITKELLDITVAQKGLE